MFVCGQCRNYRNDWDKVGSVCLGCSRTPQQRIVSAPQQRRIIRYCSSCRKGTPLGQQMREGFFCFDCLNSGAWLNKIRSRGTKTRTEDYTQWVIKRKGKPAAHFGR